MTDFPDEPLPEWTDDELSLLRSAELDRPRSQSLPAALAAVGVGSAIATSATAAHGAAAGAAGAAASAKWGGVAAASKWLAVVALSGTVAASAVVIVKRSASPPAPSAERALPVAAKHVATSAMATPTAVPADQIDLEQPSPTRTAVPRSAAPSVNPAKRAIPSQPDIRVELAVLDGAMKSLRAGNAAATLAALDRYDAQYAKTGTLQVEATALRIEALMRMGQRAHANALAAAFLSSHPKSPYAARIRALVGEAGASAR